MELIGEITKVNYNLDETTIEIKTENMQIEQVSNLMKLSGLKSNLTINKWYKKRSLSANGYLWTLLTEIANRIGSSKEEVYEQMLDRYGQVLTDEEGNAYQVTLLKKQDISQMEGHYKLIKSNDKFSAYLVLKGSSEYNSKEMATLLDGVISECKELGIETRPQEEIDSMLKEMENEKHNSK